MAVEAECSDSRDQKTALAIGERPPESICKTRQRDKILFPHLIFSSGGWRPMAGRHVGQFHSLQLLSAPHQLSSARLGEAPHPSANLRIRQRALWIVLPHVTDEILVIDHSTARFGRFSQCFVFVNVQRQSQLGTKDGGDLAEQIERYVVMLVVLDVTNRGR